jgi:hypothetical protein
MIAKAIMPHIFSPRATPISSCPDLIRASINLHEMFLGWVAGTLTSLRSLRKADCYARQ